jgi:hypothetical protein
MDLDADPSYQKQSIQSWEPFPHHLPENNSY